MRVRICIVVFHFFFSMIRPPPRSTLFPTRRSSDLAGKRRLFAAMQEEYRSLKASWGGFAGYDRLFERGAKDRKSTRLNSSHTVISYAVFCLKKKKKQKEEIQGKSRKV